MAHWRTQYNQVRIGNSFLEVRRKLINRPLANRFLQWSLTAAHTDHFPAKVTFLRSHAERTAQQTHSNNADLVKQSQILP